MKQSEFCLLVLMTIVGPRMSTPVAAGVAIIWLFSALLLMWRGE